MQNEDFVALSQKFPAGPARAGVQEHDGFTKLSEDAFLKYFANGVDPTTAKVLYAVQWPTAASIFAGRTTTAAWRSKPSWYAVSKQDYTINPDLERFLAKRMNATTVEFDAGHLSLVSQPDKVADLILSAAGLCRNRRQSAANTERPGKSGRVFAVPAKQRRCSNYSSPCALGMSCGRCDRRGRLGRHRAGRRRRGAACTSPPTARGWRCRLLDRCRCRAGLAASGLAFGIGTVRLATWAGRDGRGAAWSGAWAAAPEPERGPAAAGPTGPESGPRSALCSS